MSVETLQFNDIILEPIIHDALKKENEDREVVARDHIYSSEIGKAFFERYLKMKGVKPSIPLSPRVLGKFSVGIAIEGRIVDIFEKAGIVKEKQARVEIPETKEHLKITGYIDVIVEIKGKTIPIEIKTVNSDLFWKKKDYLGEAYPFHVMQLYTYMKAKGYPEGALLYVSKDDMCLKEVRVKYPDQELEKKWIDDVMAISKYLREGIEPPKPDYVIYEKDKSMWFQKSGAKYKINGIWVRNWEISYSQYFKQMTGFDDVEEWEYSLKENISKKNNELKTKFIQDNKII